MIVISTRARWLMAATLVTGLLVALVVALVVALASRVPLSTEAVRKQLVAILAERLDSEVELHALSFRLLPRLHAEGQGLIIRHRGRRDVPPLVSVEAFTVDADLVGVWRRHLARVELNGLTIQIPPGQVRLKPDPTATPAASGPVSTPALASTATPDSTRTSASPEPQMLVDVLVADDAQLTVLSRNPEKDPNVWYLHQLRVEAVGFDQTMPFQTLLTNAVPPGQITTSGTFGPWRVDDPALTPVSGAFVFENADLSTFKGISGILAAHGTYSGSLERIGVNGETTTPDFMVNLGGHAMLLNTTYQAVVDATNGDTTLERVDASFLGTSLVAEGGVYSTRGVKGRTVKLDVKMDKGRVEDVMRFAVKTPKAPMTGALRLHTTLTLPPGDQDVVDKLRLDGAFTIDGGRFADPGVQQKVNELSHRASAKKLGVQPSKVTSDFSGRFVLNGGALELRQLTFDVPGAIVEMDGRYALRAETLAFRGKLFMDAKVSQTVSGWKSLLLKIVDPLFRKNGKTVIPMKIGGTRDNPSFGLEIGRAIKGDSP